jgi:hypothetical protein
MMKLTRIKISTFTCTILLVVALSAVGRVSAQPDLIVTDLEVTSYTETDIYYSYTIKNVGDEPAVLEGPTGDHYDNVSVQALLSADQIYGGIGDLSAGGRVLSLEKRSQVLSGARRPWIH